MTSQRTIEYVKTRITTSTYVNSGEITTTCSVTLDDGVILTGSSVRDISAFNAQEAQDSAYDNAVDFLYSGVDLILNKTV